MPVNPTGKAVYLNADRSKAVYPDEQGVVPAEAAVLLAGPEGEISDEDVARYGLKAAAPADTKAVKKPPADK